MGKDDRVISMADFTGRSDMWTAGDALHRANEMVRPGDKAVIILLDNTDESYTTSIVQAGLSRSEMAVLLDTLSLKLKLGLLGLDPDDYENED